MLLSSIKHQAINQFAGITYHKIKKIYGFCILYDKLSVFSFFVSFHFLRGHFFLAWGILFSFAVKQKQLWELWKGQLR